ncbi:DUF4238 domain-containing protein [Streptomyces sp. ARC14]|uniref:DUF4238 domain-containing protein n=1 Tax=Streptomyces sp. ARC14 TaxID=2724152 RepID=UPI0038574402
MTKRKKRREPREFLALLESARRDEVGGSAPRKHHLVPASYLRRWAEDGKIRVTHVDKGKSHFSPPEKAARETDYYRLESPEIDTDAVPPLLFEKMLGKIEEFSAGIVEVLTKQGPDALSPPQRAQFSFFLALQITRGHSFRVANRLMVRDYFQLKYEGVTPDGVRQMLMEAGMPSTAENVRTAYAQIQEIVTGDVFFEPQDPSIVAQSGSVAAEMGGHIFARNWYTFRTKPILVTCDEPVIMIGGPPNSRRERAGVATAGVIIFPLGPSALLAMFLPHARPRGPLELDGIETAEINREIVTSSSRWAFERPSRKVTQNMPVPPPVPPFMREGPYPVQGDENRLVFRTFHPTRWANTVPPPWPVKRWWG